MAGSILSTKSLVRSKMLDVFIPVSYTHLVENVAMPLMFKGVERKKREAMAENLLRRVGLSHRLHHYPSQMSGGQQQRAGIARAFVSRPEVVFADEPTGNLDTKTTAEIMDMVMGFARRSVSYTHLEPTAIRNSIPQTCRKRWRQAR